jgi:hypothetical protein
MENLLRARIIFDKNIILVGEKVHHKNNRPSHQKENADDEASCHFPASKILPDGSPQGG